LKSEAALEEIRRIVVEDSNDATWLRQVHQKEHSLNEAVRQQCLLWRRQS